MNTHCSLILNDVVDGLHRLPDIILLIAQNTTICQEIGLMDGFLHGISGFCNVRCIFLSTIPVVFKSCTIVCLLLTSYDLLGAMHCFSKA